MDILNFLKKEKHPIVKGLYNVLLSLGYEGGFILDVEQEDELLMVNIILPYHADLDDLEKSLQNLKMELKAMDVKIGKVKGKKVEILFGLHELKKVEVTGKNIDKFLKEGTLEIKFHSAFGGSVLDFEDGASCHLLNGGTTRMGKTCLLLYICCVLYIQTKGDIGLYITSTKIKDFYPLFDLKGVECSRTSAELLFILEKLIVEYKRRDSLLNTKQLRKATDSKSVKKYYPHMYHHFKPIFLIIDEYARFSDFEEIQKGVMELVETAGFVNVHVIIASQRPDARTVLPPRIKANLLARICFTTTDKNNSIVILDQEGAEKLGKVKGRAIYLDGETNIIQVPYLDVVECDKLLQPFRKGVQEYGTTGKVSEKVETTADQVNSGSNDKALSNTLQSLLSQSVSPPSIQSEQQSNQSNQQSNETPSNGWYRLSNPQDKR